MVERELAGAKDPDIKQPSDDRGAIKWPLGSKRHKADRGKR
jgi:hypothetical protein